MLIYVKDNFCAIVRYLKSDEKFKYFSLVYNMTSKSVKFFFTFWTCMVKSIVHNIYIWMKLSVAAFFRFLALKKGNFWENQTLVNRYVFIRPSSDGTYYGMVMSVRPSGSPSVRPSVRHSFPHFSPTCFEILSWNFVHHFILMHVSSSTINFRQFLLELCPFWTSHSYKYAVFCTFLIHALTYWAEILHMTLFYSTSDQVWVSSICVNFCWSYAPFGT